jgi:hypothetical protein
VFLDELQAHAFMREPLDQGTQVIQVAGEPVHAVHDDGVPVTGEEQQLRQFRPGSVPARGLIRKDPVQNLAVELAFLVLVQGADPHISAVHPPVPPNPSTCQLVF